MQQDRRDRAGTRVRLISGVQTRFGIVVRRMSPTRRVPEVFTHVRWDDKVETFENRDNLVAL